MPRVTYLPPDIREPLEVVEAIRRRRRGRLLHLDRMLLHSPAYAKGWNALLGEVRNHLELPARLRELAICCVAALTGAEYEFHHHAPELLKAGGTRAQVDALRRMESALVDPALFDAPERAVVQLAFEMTRQVQVSDAVFAAAANALASERQVVELIGAIATYNMVSRFLVALQITSEASSSG